MFTTPYGHIGYDAYQYEATAIANAQRELNARFHRLLEIVRTESPDTFYNVSDYAFKPNATKAENFSHYIRGKEHYIEWLRTNR